MTLKYLSAISILNFAKSFATAIIEELDSRFAYLGILDKFQIFYPQNYLGMDKKNIDEYGKDSFFDILNAGLSGPINCLIYMNGTHERWR